MALTDADVQKVADLARLALTDEERARLREQLSSILSYMDVLNELDTSAIPRTAQVIEAATVLRGDEVRLSLKPADALRNAPDSEQDYFKVEGVLDTE